MDYEEDNTTQSAPDAEQRSFYPYQVVNEIKDYAIFTMDIQGYFTSWNAGAEKIFGFTADEIQGKHFRFIFPDSLREQELPEHELEVAAKDGKYEAEEWHLRKGKEMFWALNVLTAIHDSAGNVVSYTKIVKDLTERKRVEDTLYEQSEQLTRIKQDLNKFIYNASHELRAPTCNIEGLLNILDSDKPKEEVQKIAEHLRSSLSTLKEKVDEVCEMANFTHRLEQQAPEKIDLKKLIEDVRYLIRDDAAKNKVRFEMQLDMKEFVFMPSQLHLIVHQLLLNAVNFADPSKESYFRVVARPKDDGLLLEVTDNGLGISSEQHDQIFELFSKATPTSSGQGLGLYYVKRVVEQAKGTVVVNSRPGEGATFSVYLPQATSPSATPES